MAVISAANTSATLCQSIKSALTVTGSIPTPKKLAVAQNNLYAGYPWRFSHFRKTFGYANLPLDGIWAARAVSA